MACGKKDAKSQEVGGRKLMKNFFGTDARSHHFFIIFISFLNFNPMLDFDRKPFFKPH